MSKGERVDRVVNKKLSSEEELLRRLPEIDAIYDEEIRSATIRTFMRGCPDYFWIRPSSSSGNHHSPDERAEYGNWLHTKRVFAVYVNVAESWVEMGAITPKQKEQGKAATLIHDMMKYGWPSDGPSGHEGFEHTVNNHDLIAADVARNIGDAPEEVCVLIEKHMGPWGDGPNPDNEMERLFHTADNMASDEFSDIGVFFPAEEILSEWPDIIVRDYEEGDIV